MTTIMAVMSGGKAKKGERLMMSNTTMGDVRVWNNINKV